MAICGSCGNVWGRRSSGQVALCPECLTAGGFTRSDRRKLTSPRAIEIAVTEKVKARYNGVIPVQLQMTENPVMTGYVVRASIPGQCRSVDISSKDLEALSFNDLIEKVSEEILFAIFLLLDEDEDVD